MGNIGYFNSQGVVIRNIGSFNSLGFRTQVYFFFVTGFQL